MAKTVPAAIKNISGVDSIRMVGVKRGEQRSTTGNGREAGSGDETKAAAAVVATKIAAIGEGAPI